MLHQRHPQRSGAVPYAGAGATKGGFTGKDGEYSIMTGLRDGIGCRAFIIIVFLLIVGIIFLIRVPPTKDLSTDCDDSNPCTHDFLETVRGVDSGCCSHCDVPNESECESNCYDSPMCVAGNGTGTCKGHCDQGNALDCPQIHSINISGILNFGGTGAATTGTFYKLYRECALSLCL